MILRNPTHTAIAGSMLLAALTSAVVAETLSDPTRPWGANNHDGRTAPLANSWSLNSTLVSPQRRVAVINGKHVSEGEKIGNATIVEIRKQGVVLQAPGRRITLRLLPDILDKHP